jgi:hypothetical protein
VPISAIDTVSPAFQHAKQQLFQPFKVGQWAKLALVGFLAGEMSSGGCNGGNFRMPAHTGSRQQFMSAGFPHLDPLVLAGLIALAISAGFVLWLLFVYVSSVMRFVLFDSVIEKHCEIRQGWRRRKSVGFRYFLWQIVYAIAMMAGLVVLVGVPAVVAFAAGWFNRPKEHIIPLVLGGLLMFFALLAFVVLSVIVHVLTKDFVVPQMALENIGALDGWRRLLPMLKSEKGGYAGYLGMKLVLAIGAAVMVGILAVVLILIILIPVGGVGIIAVLGGKAAGLQWDVYTITAAVVAGCIVLAVLLYLISLVSVPAIVFFPAYSIHFFASRYSLLDRLLRPVAPPLPPPSLPPVRDSIG